MATFDCEVFGYIEYNSELSYTELIECENELKETLAETLHSCEAEHIDFVGLDDGLRFQFVVSEYGEAVLHEICDAVAPTFPKETTARLFAIQKDLEVAILYQFAAKGWKETALNISAGIYE